MGAGRSASGWPVGVGCQSQFSSGGFPLWPGWASHSTVVSGYMAEDFPQSPKYKLPGLPMAQA